MTDVDDIRRRMAQIRHDMHYDVSTVVGDVEEAMDWRAALRKHPYILIGAGLAAGYLLVPKRQREPARWVERDAREAQPFLDPPTAPSRPQKSLAKRTAGWAAGMLWPLISQSAQNYAAVWLENQIKQNMSVHPREASSHAAPRGPGGSGDFVYQMPKRG